MGATFNIRRMSQEEREQIKQQPTEKSGGAVFNIRPAGVSPTKGQDIAAASKETIGSTVSDMGAGATKLAAAEGAENGPAECLRCAELIVPALGALPEGLRIASMEFGRTLYDGETGRFVCHGVLEAAAHFIAREGKQDGEFTGFILRGRVEK